MAIQVGKDELDRKAEGAREERKRILRENPMHAAEELEARGLETDRTVLRNPNPAYAHRLVNRRKEGERVAQLKGMGYETVPEDDPTKLVMSATADGGQVQGDLVLMRTPIANYERRRAKKMAKYSAWLGDTNSQARDNINKIARDGGLAPAHKDVTFDESGER